MQRNAGRPEIPLDGGTSNRGLVVRVGDTVRRPQSLTSEATHALLRHLEKVGFAGAPRYLGKDDQGRDILSYVEGDAAIQPYPAWALTDSALVSVAELLRRYHDAVRTFDPTGYRWSTSVPQEFRFGLISHNDVNLDNVIFRRGEAVGLIDFDLASPGSALWDVAMVARLWVPLCDPRDVRDDRASRTHERLQLLADAYQLSERERALLVAAAQETYVWCYDIVRTGAKQGFAGYVDYWTSETEKRVERGQVWLEKNSASLGSGLRPKTKPHKRTAPASVSPGVGRQKPSPPHV